MNVLKLKSKMVEKGISAKQISKELNISLSSFYRRLSNNNGDSIKIEEAMIIGKCLNLTEREMCFIFFNHYVA